MRHGTWGALFSARGTAYNRRLGCNGGITAPRLLLWVSTAALAWLLGLSAARADIYTWTDAAGRVNISNLTPPDGVRVTNVVHETPKPPPVRPDPGDASAQADVQALSERVRQLEREIDFARRAPPPMSYAAAPAPPVVQYPDVQYSYAMQPPPQPSYGCDPSWIGCGGFGYLGWPYGYPASVVVVRAPRFHRGDAFHGMHRNPMPAMRPPPGRAPGGGHRR